MRASFLGIVCALVLPTMAKADDRPYRLICFEDAGIRASLNHVPNIQQFLQNDRVMQSGSCSFAQLPSGSTARYVGIHSTEAGFHFPIYRVTYATTGQRMFSADGVFSSDHWNVRTLRGTEIEILSPASCAALHNYQKVTNRTPRYVVVPNLCSVEIVE